MTKISHTHGMEVLMDETNRKLFIFSGSEGAFPASAAKPSPVATRSVGKTWVHEVSVGVLKASIQSFMQSLDEILQSAPKEVGGLELSEIAIHAQIDGAGNIGLKGLCSVAIETQGGIDLILRKKQ